MWYLSSMIIVCHKTRGAYEPRSGGWQKKKNQIWHYTIDFGCRWNDFFFFMCENCKTNDFRIVKITEHTRIRCTIIIYFYNNLFDNITWPTRTMTATTDETEKRKLNIITGLERRTCLLGSQKKLIIIIIIWIALISSGDCGGVQTAHCTHNNIKYDCYCYSLPFYRVRPTRMYYNGGLTKADSILDGLG